MGRQIKPGAGISLGARGLGTPRTRVVGTPLQGEGELPCRDKITPSRVRSPEPLAPGGRRTVGSSRTGVVSQVERRGVKDVTIADGTDV